MEKKKVPRSIQKLVVSRVQVSFHTYTTRYTRTHQAPHIFSFDTVRPAISSNGSCPAMGALSSARRLNDVARGPTTSELGTFIENESPPYMQPPKNTVSHTMHPWKTIRALSSPSLSPSLSLSVGEKHPLPGCSNNKNTRDIPNDKAKTGFKYFTNGETNGVQIEILSLIRPNEKWISNGA